MEVHRLIYLHRSRRDDKQLRCSQRRIGFPGLESREHALAEPAARIPEEDNGAAPTKIDKIDRRQFGELGEHGIQTHLAGITAEIEQGDGWWSAHVLWWIIVGQECIDLGERRRG